MGEASASPHFFLKTNLSEKFQIFFYFNSRIIRAGYPRYLKLDFWSLPGYHIGQGLFGGVHDQKD